MAAARVTSVATRRFWTLFQALPTEVQNLAIKNCRLWRRDPHHPALRFRRLQGSEDRFSVRVGDHYRALGIKTSEKMIWAGIGTHSDYDRMVRSCLASQRSVFRRSLHTIDNEELARRLGWLELQPELFLKCGED